MHYDEFVMEIILIVVSKIVLSMNSKVTHIEQLKYLPSLLQASNCS